MLLSSYKNYYERDRMLLFIFCFISSVITIKIILFTSNEHFKISMDSDTTGVQKYHKKAVPRIGGLAIFVSLVLTGLLSDNLTQEWSSYFSGLIVATFLVFVGGFTEDITKQVRPSSRILFMLAGTLVAIYLTKSLPLITSAHNYYIDIALGYELFALLLTLLCVLGLTNAYNIIDGFNGLSGTAALFNLLGLTILAYTLQDLFVFKVGISVIAAICGFLAFNYPRGKIFLGDGGAYSLGFIIAVLSIKLITNYPQLSPYTVLLLAIYPVFELAFSIYRRKIIRKTASMQPDNLHLHQLIYHRCVAMRQGGRRNQIVMPKMLWFIVPQIIIAICFARNQRIILGAIVVYMIIYSFTYWRIVKFKAPRLLKFFR